MCDGARGKTGPSIWRGHHLFGAADLDVFTSLQHSPFTFLKMNGVPVAVAAYDDAAFKGERRQRARKTAKDAYPRLLISLRCVPDCAGGGNPSSPRAGYFFPPDLPCVRDAGVDSKRGSSSHESDGERDKGRPVRRRNLNHKRPGSGELSAPQHPANTPNCRNDNVLTGDVTLSVHVQ